MSILSQTSRDVVTIERLVVTPSTTGGQVRTYSTANRGSLPTSLPCRIQLLDTEERVQFGVRSEQRVWKLLFASNPQITVEDRLVFTDSNGQTHTARVLEPSRNLDMQNRLYRAVAEETGNEQ